MSKTILYLIRHGEAEGNITMRTHGITDTDLTLHGREQIALLGKRFESIELDAVFASNLRRAIKTAHAVADPHKLEVQIVPELHEVSMGVFEDCSWHEIKHRYPLEAAAWERDFYGYRIPGGESYIEGGERVKKAVLQLLTENAGKTIAAVSHAMAIRTFLAATGNTQFAGYSANTAVTRIVYDTEREELFVEYANDASHLPEGGYFPLDDAGDNGEKLDGYSLEYIPSFEPESVALSGEIVGYQLGERAGKISYSVRGELLEIAGLSVEEGFRGRGFASQLLGEAMYRGKHLGAKKTAIPAALVKSGSGAARSAEKNDFKYDPVTDSYIK